MRLKQNSVVDYADIRRTMNYKNLNYEIETRLSTPTARSINDRVPMNYKNLNYEIETRVLKRAPYRSMNYKNLNYEIETCVLSFTPRL